MNYYDTKLNRVITDSELARRGLTSAIAKQAGIIPMEYQYIAYNDELYTQEPHELIVGTDKAVQTFVAVPVDVEIGKKKMLEKVQAEKVRARDGGFMVADTLFDSDISARTSYTELGLRLSQNPSFETQWKASAGQWVVMDAALYSQVVIAGEAHITAVFAWQAAKEIEIGNCENVEELEAVDITYGGGQ